MSADRMVGGASAQKNNAVPLRKNQRKSLENSCRNTKNRLANPGSGALPNHNRQESCASMGTTLVFNICYGALSFSGNFWKLTRSCLALCVVVSRLFFASHDKKTCGGCAQNKSGRLSQRTQASSIMDVGMDGGEEEGDVIEINDPDQGQKPRTNGGSCLQSRGCEQGEQAQPVKSADSKADIDNTASVNGCNNAEGGDAEGAGKESGKDVDDDNHDDNHDDEAQSGIVTEEDVDRLFKLDSSLPKSV